MRCLRQDGAGNAPDAPLDDPLSGARPEMPLFQLATTRTGSSLRSNDGRDLHGMIHDQELTGALVTSGFSDRIRGTDEIETAGTAGEATPGEGRTRGRACQRSQAPKRSEALLTRASRQQSRPDSNWRFRLERPARQVIVASRLPGEMRSDLVIRTRAVLVRTHHYPLLLVVVRDR